MITVGIDAATCTGMAVVGEGEDRGKTVKVPTLRGFQRVQLIADDVRYTLQAWNPEFVLIEGYAYVKNVGAFVKLVEVGTAIRMSLRQIGVPWLEVPPTVLKKWVTGKGNADKDLMAEAAWQRWQYRSHSHDIVDAYCLAQLAQLGWAEVLTMTGVSVGWENKS